MLNETERGLWPPSAFQNFGASILKKVPSKHFTHLPDHTKYKRWGY